MDCLSNAPSSPRNDSLLRTVLPLQQLAYVRLAVQASNQIDTPPVNPTNCQNRDIDLLTTRPTSAFRYDHPATFNDSTDLSFPLRSSSYIQRLDRSQLSATIIQLHSTTRPISAFRYDHPATFNDSTDLSCPQRSSSYIQQRF